MKTTDVFRLYIWMIETFRRERALTLREFNDLWTRTELSCGSKMPRSSFNYNRDAIFELFGVNIVCDHGTNRYYIKNYGDLRDEGIHQWLIETISIGSLVSESKGLHDRILLDRIPVGGFVLTESMRAIKQGVKVKIMYRKFTDSEAKEVVGGPLCLKAFRNRWSLLLDTPSHQEPALYSLDRISGISLSKESYAPPIGFDSQAYFMDSFGVFVGSNFPVERIKLKIYGSQRYYLRTLPLHHSQVEMERHEDWSLFSLRLRPTLDFQQEILSRGADIEVLEPASLRDAMAERVRQLAGRYGL